jgi:glycosyltransferase involved in cell wall biosynthesis
MRILLVVVYYLPSTMSSAKLIHDLAVEFLRLGHEPMIAAPDDTIRSEYDMSMESGINVLRIRTGEIKSASRWMRAWREITLSRVMWQKGRDVFLQNPCDLIIYYSPTIFFGGLVKTLKKRFACPSYLVLRDIFPQWAVDAGVLKKGPAYAFFKWKERLNYDAADVIGVQSPANLEYFAADNTATGRHIEVLYNWASVNVPAGGRNFHRRQLGLSDKIVFFYGGNIGVAQDMDNILRLAERLRHESSAYFLLVGSGSEADRLKKEIGNRRLTNIMLHDAVDQDAYLAMLSEFDVGLISLDRRLRNQNFPGKMLSYMNYSLPILASINPGNDLGDLLETRDAGLACLNGDDDRFEALARSLLKDQELRIRLGKNARAMLDDCFSVRGAAQQILSHVRGRETIEG